MSDQTSTSAPAVSTLERVSEHTLPAVEPVPSQWRLTAVLVLLAGLADITIYRGGGFTGFAAFLVAAPPLMFAAARRLAWRLDTLVLYAMLALLAGKLVWCGTAFQVAVGFGLLTGFAVTLNGQQPHVLWTAVFASHTVMAGYVGLRRQWEAARANLPAVSTAAWLAVALPAGALFVFGLLFVLANPDLAKLFGTEIERSLRFVREWFEQFDLLEAAFWLAVMWIACGALRPLLRVPADEEPTADALDATAAAAERRPHGLYGALRNTLVTVVLLFGAYLVFEFQTLWFREFPPGFHYSGYAHEGAFWLTVCLALATLMLSLIFRGSVLREPRLAILRRLALVWSIENLLLAIAVYHRLLIYVGFNGMTRLRVVGFLGISAVVVGFVLVQRKIAARRSVVWLVRRQLWALAAFVYLYAVLPVDALVMRYNAERILAGDPAPAVQISVQRIDEQGLLQLPRLLASEDATIREGVRALLAEQAERWRRGGPQASQQDWSEFQWAEQRLRERLRGLRAELNAFASDAERADALREFHQYVYQWY
ncbi:MAG: DUF4173 domain-containing protein [Planctomycetes bacterium]|nr:DUF4173 domain-containing protein [Planctomycetota bacterium]